MLTYNVVSNALLCVKSGDIDRRRLMMVRSTVFLGGSFICLYPCSTAPNYIHVVVKSLHMHSNQLCKYVIVIEW